MLKVKRTSLTIPPSFDEPSSAPKMTLIQKRGFKANTSACVLTKRHSLEVDSQILDRIKSFHNPKPRRDSFADQSCDSSSSDPENDDSKNNLDDCSTNWTHSSQAAVNESQRKDLPEKLYRVMVVGPRDIGKRSFVHNLFSATPSTASLPKQFFDLITKVITEDSCTKRYNFWLKELIEMKKDYKMIIDVYYKTCSAFFLIYDPEDEKSCEILEKELEMLTSVNSNCSIILVEKRTTDNDPSKISKEMAERLKEKYTERIYFNAMMNFEPSKDLLKIIDQFPK